MMKLQANFHAQPLRFALSHLGRPNTRHRYLDRHKSRVKRLEGYFVVPASYQNDTGASEYQIREAYDEYAMRRQLGAVP